MHDQSAQWGVVVWEYEFEGRERAGMEVGMVAETESDGVSRLHRARWE